jgi:hypothetical protein
MRFKKIYKENSCKEKKWKCSGKKTLIGEKILCHPRAIAHNGQIPILEVPCKYTTHFLQVPSNLFDSLRDM